METQAPEVVSQSSSQNATTLKPDYSGRKKKGKLQMILDYVNKKKGKG
jgi:hypothetical protein